MTPDSLLTRYRKLREPGVLRDRLLLNVPRERKEIELQAHWFNGDFGSEFTAVSGEPVRVIQFGVWNHEAGPDFIEAAVRVGDGPVRRGAIELDLDVRDWERHGHAANPAYRQVVLHLFFRAPKERAFTRTDHHGEVPQVRLSLEQLDTDITPRVPSAHPGLCCAPLQEWTPQQIGDLLEGAARYRMECKALRFARHERIHGANEALFQALAMALGYKENKLPFQLLAQRLPLARLRADPARADALLFGIAGFLGNPDLAAYGTAARGYVRGLWEIWWAARSEFERLVLPPDAWKRGGMRPVNHPQRRLGALAATVAGWAEFQKRFRRGSPGALREFLESLRHPFWDTHYTLSSPMKEGSPALVGKARAGEILANVYYPHRVTADRALWEDYLKVPAAGISRPVATATERLFGGNPHKAAQVKGLARQQGLLQIYSDFCLRDASDCADCPFPRQLQHWRGKD